MDLIRRSSSPSRSASNSGRSPTPFPGFLVAVLLCAALACLPARGAGAAADAVDGCIVNCGAPNAAPAAPVPAAAPEPAPRVTLDAIGDMLGYTVDPFLLTGALIALEIAAASMVAGVALGLGLALMRLSRFKAVSGIAWTYIWFMRGTPPLLATGVPLRRLAALRHQAWASIHDRRARLRSERGRVQRRNHSRRHPVGQSQPEHRRRLASGWGRS